MVKIETIGLLKYPARFLLSRDFGARHSNAIVQQPSFIWVCAYVFEGGLKSEVQHRFV
jgi:hypothetical protein